MRTLIELSASHATQTPQKTALIMLDERGNEASRLTYAELHAKARAIAACLQHRYEPGDRALMLYRAGPEFITAFLGCQYAGLIPVPVSFYSRKSHHLRRIEGIKKNARVALVMTSSQLHADVASWLQAGDPNELQCVASDDISDDADWKLPVVDQEGIAFLQYTSGSTSEPKGVMVTHRSLAYNVQLIKQWAKTGADTVIGGWLPFSHDMGLIGLILHSIYIGATLVLMSPISFVKRPSGWLNAISKYRIQFSGSPNFGIEHCTRRIRDEEITDIDLSCWRMCFNGAEPVRQETIESFVQRFAPYGFRPESFCPCYGLAEATLFVSGCAIDVAHDTLRIDRDELEQHRVAIAGAETRKPGTLVSCGQPYVREVAIVDRQTFTRLPERQVGEVWVHCDSVAKGYWERPEETRETFRAVLANEESPAYMRTGDLGFIDCGQLYITGRIKDLLIINGRNIYPQDIEKQIGQLDQRFANTMGAAFSIEGPNGEQAVIVQEVETRGGVQPETLVSLAERVRLEIGGHFEIPVSEVVLISSGSLPRTTSGKVQRRRTKLLWQEKSLDVLYSSAAAKAPQRDRAEAAETLS